MNETQIVAVDTVFRLLTPRTDPGSETPAMGLPVPVQLRYFAADPFAVHLRFVTGPAREVNWVFARELLTDGLLAEVGLGDVRVWPARDPGRDTVVVELNSPSGHARFEASASAVAEFLDRSFAVVGRGAESRRAGLDAALVALLAADGI